MTEAFILSFKLRIAYRVNGILFRLGHLPLLGKYLPTRLYDTPWLKTLALVLAVLGEIGGLFLGKLIYLGIFLGAAAVYIRPEQVGTGAYCLHVFFFLSLVGAVFNNGLCVSDANVHYAVFLMRMDARHYALSNYFYFLVKTFLGLAGAMALLYGMGSRYMDTADFDPLWILLMPLFTVCAKLALSGVNLWIFDRRGKLFNERYFTKIVYSLLLLLWVAAYLLPLTGIVLPETLFYVILGALGSASLPALIRIIRSRAYRRIYQDNPWSATRMTDLQKSVQDSYRERLVLEAGDSSQRSGCAFLNEIFVRRHRNLLTRPILRVAAVLGVFLAAALIACLVNREAAALVNENLMAVLPYFLLVMYFINRGESTTRLLFFSCDCHLLPYRFYRQPRVILDLFKVRLKTIAGLNLIPALVLALGLPLLLYVSGGTGQPLNYLLLFFSILIMSVFFSVHYLVLYYLLQPYTAGLEVKSHTYTMFTLMTYWVCYIFGISLGKRIPPLVFGGVLMAFCLLYMGLALLLAYKRAPKSFKLR